MAKIDQQVAVAKSLVGDQLNPKQLEELMTLSDVDLIIEHGLTDAEAEKVLTHAKREMYRMRAQGYSFGTMEPEERVKVSYPTPPTRTNPIYESKQGNSTKITKRQLRQIIREAIDSDHSTAIDRPLTAFDIVNAIKDFNLGSVFVTPRRNDRFEISGRWVGVVSGPRVEIFDSYVPRGQRIVVSTSMRSASEVAREIDSEIRRLEARV